VDRAKKDYDDTFVRAEIAGRVGRALLDLGARVTGRATCSRRSSRSILST